MLKLTKLSPRLVCLGQAACGQVGPLGMSCFTGIGLLVISYSSLIQKFFQTFAFSAQTAVLEFPEAGFRRSVVSLVSLSPTTTWAGRPPRSHRHIKKPLDGA